MFISVYILWFCEVILNLNQWFRSTCHLKTFLIELQLWWQSCLAERNHIIGNFGRGHYEEHFCKIILNLDQWFRCHLKYFLSTALVAI